MPPARIARLWILLAVSVLSRQAAVAQTDAPTSPYSGMETREIKALSPEQIDGYRSGRGMGFALAAELNGYPGPKHVLELRDQLQLTDAQAEKTEQVFTSMKSAAIELGNLLVDGEQALEHRFAAGAIDGDSLSEAVAEIARTRGRLRVVHLQAHLRMREILTPEQIAHYVELRGYHSGGHSRQHPGRHDGGH